MTAHDVGDETMTHNCVARIFDLQLIRETITNPKVYPYVSDDFSPSIEDYEPPVHDLIIYLGAYQGDEYHGLFMLHPVNGVTFEVHTCLLPSARGMAKEFANLVIDWLWANTTAVRLITQVPTYNRLAKKLALDAGMSEYGLNPRSYQYNGGLYDIHLMGISREGICQ